MASRRSSSSRRRREQLANFKTSPTGARPRTSAASTASAGTASKGTASKGTAPKTARTTAPTSSRKSGGSRGGGPKLDRDGRALVACPQCATQYKVAEEKLDTKLVCSNCKRSFFPKAVSGRKPKENNAQPFIIGGVVLGVVVVLGVIIANMEPTRVEMAPPEKVVKVVNIGWDHPRVQSAVLWTNAIAEKEDFNLSRHSDIFALRAPLGLGVEDADPKEKVIAALMASDQTKVFQDFKAYAGSLGDRSMHEATEGSVHLELQPREGTLHYDLMQKDLKKKKRYYAAAFEAKAMVSFRMEGPDLKVTGFEVLHMPKKPKPRGRIDKPHATIEKPEEVERVDLATGQKVKVKESKLSPLGHLEDTPPALRKEIDGHIESMMDLEGSGAITNRAIFRLKKIGRPAIPRLLNKMYEIEPKTLQDSQRLRRVIQALQALSGMRFGFNVDDPKGVSQQISNENRISSLKQWYAWWYERHDEDYNTSIDPDDDDVLLTEEEKAAKKKAAEASGKKK